MQQQQQQQQWCSSAAASAADAPALECANQPAALAVRQQLRHLHCSAVMSNNSKQAQHHRPDDHRLLPKLTPASVIGMVLFFFFISQLFVNPLRSARQLATSAAGGSRRFGGSDEDEGTARVWRGRFLDVSLKSHEYLQRFFPGRKADAFVGDVTARADAHIAEQLAQVGREVLPLSRASALGWPCLACPRPAEQQGPTCCPPSVLALCKFCVGGAGGEGGVILCPLDQAGPVALGGVGHQPGHGGGCTGVV